MSIMRITLLLISATLLMFSCGKNSNKKTIYVNNILELNKVLEQTVPGDEIVLANGVW